MKCRQKFDFNSFIFAFKDFFCRVVTAFLPEKKLHNDKSTSYSKAIYFSRMVPDNYCCIECLSCKFPSVRRSISKLFLHFFGLSNRFLPLFLSERFHRINKDSEIVVQNFIKKMFESLRNNLMVQMSTPSGDKVKNTVNNS